MNMIMVFLILSHVTLKASLKNVTVETSPYGAVGIQGNTEMEKWRLDWLAVSIEGKKKQS